MTDNVKQWIAAARKARRDRTKARVLPIVRIEDDYFFVDSRMTALRNIDTLEIHRFDSLSDLTFHVKTNATVVT